MTDNQRRIDVPVPHLGETMTAWVDRIKADPQAWITPDDPQVSRHAERRSHEAPLGEPEEQCRHTAVRLESRPGGRVLVCLSCGTIERRS